MDITFTGQRTKEVTITKEGRDKGKTFRIFELRAYYADRWARRALSLIGKGALEAKNEIQASGMAAIWAMGIQALVYVEDNDAIDKLLDEMYALIEIKEEMAQRDIIGWRQVDILNDIAEVETIFTLRQEVLQLHVNFSMLGATSPNTSEKQLGETAPITSPTPTSPTSSARSFRRGRRQ